MTYADSLHTHHTEAVAIVGEIAELIALRECEGILPLCVRLSELASEMADDAYHLEVARYCGAMGNA